MGWRRKSKKPTRAGHSISSSLSVKTSLHTFLHFYWGFRSKKCKDLFTLTNYGIVHASPPIRRSCRLLNPLKDQIHLTASFLEKAPFMLFRQDDHKTLQIPTNVPTLHHPLRKRRSSKLKGVTSGKPTPPPHNLRNAPGNARSD